VGPTRCNEIKGDLEAELVFVGLLDVEIVFVFVLDRLSDIENENKEADEVREDVLVRVGDFEVVLVLEGVALSLNDELLDGDLLGVAELDLDLVRETLPEAVFTGI